MDRIDLSKEDKFVSHAVSTPCWVTWEEVIEAFPDYKDNFIGKNYKPTFSFFIPPAAVDEEFNTSVVAVVRIENGYQDVVMARPLPHNAKSYTLQRGFTAAVDLALRAIGDYYAVASYLNK